MSTIEATVILPPTLAARLEKILIRRHMKPTEAIERALALYVIAAEKEVEGMTIGFSHDASKIEQPVQNL